MVSAKHCSHHFDYSTLLPSDSPYLHVGCCGISLDCCKMHTESCHQTDWSSLCWHWFHAQQCCSRCDPLQNWRNCEVLSSSAWHCWSELRRHQETCGETSWLAVQETWVLVELGNQHHNFPLHLPRHLTLPCTVTSPVSTKLHHTAPQWQLSTAIQVPTKGSTRLKNCWTNLLKPELSN